MKFIPDTLRAH